MRRVCCVMVAVIMAVSAGCGGGDDKANPAADREKAEKAAPKAADFPSGWTAKPHEKLPLEDELAVDIAECLGVTAPAARASAQVRSQDFTSGFATTASSVITFVKTKEEAAADAAAFAQPKFAECARPGYERQMGAVAPEGATLEGVTISKSSFPKYGDRTVSYLVHGEIRLGEIKVHVNVDLVWVFKDRAEIFLTFSKGASQSPFPREVARAVTVKVVERL